MTRMRTVTSLACLCSVFAALVPASTCLAGSLRVAPILLEIPAPAATATLNLRNEGDRDMHVQMRVFRWTGTRADPTLEPTSDVVVSPPAAMLTPGTEYVVRVVRVTKKPVDGEES